MATMPARDYLTKLLVAAALSLEEIPTGGPCPPKIRDCIHQRLTPLIFDAMLTLADFEEADIGHDIYI